MNNKNLFWLLSLMMLVSLCMFSCNKDDDKEQEKLEAEMPKDPTTALVKLKVLNEDNLPQQTTVYMCTEKSEVSYESKALTYEDSDENGIVKFVINADDLNGNYNKTFYFWCKGDEVFENGENSVAIKAGEGKTDTLIMKAKLASDYYKVDKQTIKANADGTISVSIDLNFNNKFKSFIIIDTQTNKTIYDFLKENQSLIEKNNNIPESRRIADVKTENMTITTANLPIKNYTISWESENSHKNSVDIGTIGIFSIGSVNISYVGCFASLDRMRSYLFSEAKYASVQVFAVSSGSDITGLKKATLVKNTDIANNADKVFMIQDGKQVDEVHEGGIIITQSGIYLVKTITNKGEYADIEIQGYNSGIDVSAFPF